MNALLTRVSSVFTQNMTNLFTVRAAIVCIAVVIKLQFLGLSHCSLIIMNGELKFLRPCLCPCLPFSIYMYVKSYRSKLYSTILLSCTGLHDSLNLANLLLQYIANLSPCFCSSIGNINAR